MSAKEIDRASVLRQVQARQMTKRRAAALLCLSERQLYRLYDRFVAEGDAGLISRKRGRRSNRALDDEVRETALALVRERYGDFGPTLAHEKLSELHRVPASAGTIRNWMILHFAHQTKLQNFDLLWEVPIGLLHLEDLILPLQPNLWRDSAWLQELDT